MWIKRTHADNKYKVVPTRWIWWWFQHIWKLDKFFVFDNGEKTQSEFNARRNPLYICEKFQKNVGKANDNWEKSHSRGVENVLRAVVW